MCTKTISFARGGAAAKREESVTIKTSPNRKRRRALSSDQKKILVFGWRKCVREEDQRKTGKTEKRMRCRRRRKFEKNKLVYNTKDR
jgi:hypothetical protein